MKTKSQNISHKELKKLFPVNINILSESFYVNNIRILPLKELKNLPTKRLISYKNRIRNKKSAIWERNYCCEDKCYHTFDDDYETNFPEDVESYQFFSEYLKIIKNLLFNRENIKN